MTTAIEQRTLTITRIFDAPREAVWNAWTDPEHVMRWWGPRAYTSPAAKMDLRVGGTYVFCMRSEGGMDIWSGGVIREVVPMERLVMTDNFTDEDGNAVPASTYGMDLDFPETVITVTFEDIGEGKTRMTMTHDGLPGGEHIEDASEGWNQSLDKLAAALR
jgi:uncharacterized protein YndB with AHSA1/START domain